MVWTPRRPPCFWDFYTSKNNDSPHQKWQRYDQMEKGDLWEKSQRCKSQGAATATTIPKDTGSWVRVIPAWFQKAELPLIARAWASCPGGLGQQVLHSNVARRKGHGARTDYSQAWKSNGICYTRVLPCLAPKIPLFLPISRLLKCECLSYVCPYHIQYTSLLEAGNVSDFPGSQLE